MFKKSMRKLACGILAVASVTACMSTFTACETAHPEVQMTIKFGTNEYVLEYQLYRNIAPATTNHFLWLVENNYYDGLCVHDYSSEKMYTGVYQSDDESENGLKYKEYYTEVAKLNAAAVAAGRSAFPVSVYAIAEKTSSNALYTLYGEFEDNNFQVENGDKTEAFGSLTMYYHAKSSNDDRVYVQRNDDANTLAGRNYKYNSATSQFYITLSDSNASSTAYCTFAYLVDDEDNIQQLKNLQQAIADAEEAAEEEGGSFTESHTLRVDEDDVYVSDVTTKKTFKVPTTAIVITDITVTKF